VVNIPNGEMMKNQKFIRISSFFGMILIIFLLCMSFASGEEMLPQESGLQIQGVPYHFPPSLPGEERNASKMITLPESEYVLVESSQSRDLPETLHLYNNLNYISIPLWLEDGYSTYGECFDGYNIIQIYRWDNYLGYWVWPNSTDEIIPLEGFAIKANGAQDVTLHFKAEQYQIPPTRYLYDGWSIVGSWDIPQWSARDNFISVVNAWTQATGWDAEHQQSETSIINGGSGIHSDQRVIYPGKGYWFWMDDPGTLVPLKGTADFQDLNYPQVGVEWVNDYQVNPLSNSDDTALGFYNTLGNAGWVQMFEYGDDEAQVDHFTNDGVDWKFIDGVDIALFAGHGSFNITGNWIRLMEPNIVLFPTCKWGDHDLDWIFLHGCHTTKYPVNFKSFPFWAMNGVHLVCGYDTVGWDCDDGTTLATKLLQGKNVTQAWFEAIDITHDSQFLLRVVGENQDCGNDYIWGVGSVLSDPTVDSQVYQWDYQCQN
jgi:hypothetical protein